MLARFALPIGLICALCPPLPVVAQDAPGLSLELNKLEATDDGCALSFLVVNGHADDIASLVYETVLLDKNGLVDRLTLFDFGALPAGRPRVRQFVVPGLACDALGQVLINGASSCEAGTAGESACTDGLDLGSRVDIEVIG